MKLRFTRRHFLAGAAAGLLLPAIALATIPPRPVSPVFIIAGDNPAAVSDLYWYCAARGLPVNALFFTFGGLIQLVDVNLNGGGVTVSAAYYNGVLDSSFNGQGLETALTNWAAKYTTDAVVAGTYTPTYRIASPSGAVTPLAGWAAEWIAPVNVGSVPLPCGRLGFPSNPSSGTFVSTSELVPQSGANLLRQCTTNAISAEKVDNRGYPHLLSSVMAYGPYELNSDNAASLALGRQQLLAAVNLGVDIPYGTASSNDFLNGVVSPPQPMFAYCIGQSQNTSGYAGHEPFTANYSPLPGAWGFDWGSGAFHLAADLLWKGGSSALSTFGEPSANGLRDPMAVLQALLTQGLCMLQIPNAVTVAYAGGGSPVAASAPFSGNLIAVGDVFEAPYAASVKALPLILGLGAI